MTVTAGSGEPTPQEMALIAALRLLENEPGHTDAQMVVANAQACLGNRDQAKVCYERLLSEDVYNAAANAVRRRALEVLAATQ